MEQPLILHFAMILEICVSGKDFTILSSTLLILCKFLSDSDDPKLLVSKNFTFSYRTYNFLPKIEDLARAHFPDLLSIVELERKTQLLFVNTQPGIDPPESLPPNIINVGGIQIVAPKPLSIEIESFINASGSGAVLFSFGTNFKSSMLTEQKQLAFIGAFKRFPQYNFIWKFDVGEISPNAELPKNLLIKSWVNQNDILAHKKIVAFISHMGLLSTHETKFWGKPVVGIPIFIDQHRVSNFHDLRTFSRNFKHFLLLEHVPNGKEWLRSKS